MANDPSRYGERIATLETKFGDLVSRLNHLDNCLDEAKENAKGNFESIREKLSEWDVRFKVGLGVIVGMVIAAGSGTISLKSLIEWFSKLH